MDPLGDWPIPSGAFQKTYICNQSQPSPHSPLIHLPPKANLLPLVTVVPQTCIPYRFLNLLTFSMLIVARGRLVTSAQIRLMKLALNIRAFSKAGILPSLYRPQAQQVIESGRLHSLFSRLELGSIATSTMIDYVSRLLFFVRWATVNHLDWTSPKELDSLLVLCFDELFDSNMQAAEGSKLLAALKFMTPVLFPTQMNLFPRAHRALRTWTARRPPAQRVPFPWLGLTAVIGYLCFHSMIPCALALLIQFHTYLRPGICDALQVSQLVAPHTVAGAGHLHWALHLYPTELLRPGKTGGFDEAVLIDNFAWIHPFLSLLIDRRDPLDRLWPIAPAVVRSQFQAALAALGMQQLEVSRYALRHGGASHDMLTQSRSMLAIQNRGHWRSNLSLARYGKPARALKELHRINPAVVEYGKAVANNLEAVFHRQLVLAPPVPSLCQKRGST